MPQRAADDSNPAIADLLDRTNRQLGRIPNLYRAMANSPATLAGYLALREQLQAGVLQLADRERIALLVAQLNDCSYCVAAHTFRGSRLGLTDLELADVRRGHSEDPRVEALLRFVSATVRSAGNVAPAELAQAREGGISDEELVEVVGHVALNVLSNYVNHLAQPDLDFPAAVVLDEEAAGIGIQP